MKHYHGGPITPDTCAIKAWQSRFALVSFMYQQQLELAFAISAGVALDNGGFSAWKQKHAINWQDFYRFVERWRNHPRFDWATNNNGVHLRVFVGNKAVADVWPTTCKYSIRKPDGSTSKKVYNGNVQDLIERIKP